MTIRSFVLYFVVSLVLAATLGSCKRGSMSVEKRKEKLEQKKRRHPDDCPKLDC